MINQFDNSNSKLNIFSYITPNFKKFLDIKIIKDKFSNKAHYQKAAEVFNTVLPLLNLYRPAAVVLIVGGGLLQAGGHFVQAIQEGKKGNGKACAKQSFHCVLAIISIAGSVFQYRIGLVITSGYELAASVCHLAKCIYRDPSPTKVAGAFFQAIRHSIHFISAVAPSPQIVIISLVVQVAFEAYESFDELKRLKSDHNFLGLAVKVILLGVHSYQLGQQSQLLWQARKAKIAAAPEGVTSNGQTIPPAELEKVLADFHAQKQQASNSDQTNLSFADFLKERGYSDSQLSNINFSQALKKASEQNESYVDLFQDVDFSGLSFTNCSFDELNLNGTRFNGVLKSCGFQLTALEGARFVNCQMQKTNFQLANLTHVEVSQSLFNECNFTFAYLNKAQFINSKIQGSLFKQANLTKFNSVMSQWETCSFEKALFNEGQFIESQISENTIATGACFTNAALISCEIKDCNFADSIFKGTYIKNLVATNVNFSDVSFNYAQIDRAILNQVTLNYACFHDANLKGLNIQQGTLFGASFLDAKVKACRIENSDLLNTLFFDTKTQFKLLNCTDNEITLPIVCLPWNVSTPGFTVPKVYRSLKTYGSIPLKVDYLPDNVDTFKLDSEIKAEIAAISQQFPADSKDILSIPSEILNRATPGSEIWKIQQRAQHYMQYASAIVLPGGNNVEGEFYRGKRVDNIAYYDPDYRRTVFECSLLHQAAKDDVPVIAICRGFQLMNVYFGGTIRDVEDQWSKIQEYHVQEGVIRELLGEKIIGVSTHRQAVDRVADVLKVVVDYEGIVKAAEGRDGKKYYGFQFHPEWVLDNKDISKENENVFIYHITCAKNYIKKKVEIASMLAVAA